MTKSDIRRLFIEIGRRVRSWTTWDALATRAEFSQLLMDLKDRCTPKEFGILLVLQFAGTCDDIGVNVGQSVKLALLHAGDWNQQPGHERCIWDEPANSAGQAVPPESR